MEAHSLSIEAIAVVAIQPNTLRHTTLGADFFVAQAPALTALIPVITEEGGADVVIGDENGRDTDRVVLEVAQHDVSRFVFFRALLVLDSHGVTGSWVLLLAISVPLSKTRSILVPQSDVRNIATL
jgi:hypothetical protein